MATTIDRKAVGDGVRTGVLAVAGALALWATTTYLAAVDVGYSPWSTRSWARWDSGWYREIALHGYTLGHCEDVPLRTPEDWCGSTAWFPGFPYAMRGLHGLDVEINLAGRLVASAAFVAAFAVLWLGFLRHRPLTRAVPAMALAAVFPGAVYYGAVFPISLLVAAILGTLVLMQRERWLAAGVCGMVATVVYSSGVTLAIVAVVPLLTPRLGSLGRRVAAGFQIGLPIVAAYGLVLLDFRRSVGRWNAWFLVQEGYGHELGSPITTFTRRLKMVWGDMPTSELVGTRSSWIGGQSLLVLGLVLIAAVVVARTWSTLGPGERGAAILAVPLWLVPLTIGDALSIHRAEAVLVVIVVLLARAPAAVTWVATGVALVVTYGVSRLFFTHELI